MYIGHFISKLTRMDESETRDTQVGISGILAIILALSDCAQMPEPMANIGWVDHRGDRGQGVLARDYLMCAELIEQRRSLMAGCMAPLGWQIKGD